MSADSLVRAVPVVVVNPALEHRGALRGMVVGNSVGPFAQGRLNESLGFAVGLRAIGPREGVFDAQAPAGVSKAPGSEGCAVVREHSSHRHSERGKVGGVSTQEGRGVVAAFSTMHLGKADTRMIIDANEQELPTRPAGAIARVARDAVAQALDAPKLLGVDVQQISRALMLIANDR